MEEDYDFSYCLNQQDHHQPQHQHHHHRLRSPTNTTTGRTTPIISNIKNINSPKHASLTSYDENTDPLFASTPSINATTIITTEATAAATIQGVTPSSSVSDSKTSGNSSHLYQTRASLFRETHALFMNNEFVANEPASTIRKLSPDTLLAVDSTSTDLDTTSTGVATVSQCSTRTNLSIQNVDIAVAAARNAFATGSPWRSYSNAYRRELILRLVNLIEHDETFLMKLEIMDRNNNYVNNKPSSSSSDQHDHRQQQQIASNLHLVVQCYRYHANQIVAVDEEPIGVCGYTIPSHFFPLLQQAWKLGPALAHGNTVVIKTIGNKTCYSVSHVCELAQKAGFPPGVVNMLNGLPTEENDYLACHPNVDKVISSHFGSRFNNSSHSGVSRALEHIIESYASTSTHKRQLLIDLGDTTKPIVVFDKDELETAIKKARAGLFIQPDGLCRCAYPSHYFVQNGIFMVTGQLFQVGGVKCRCRCIVQFARCGLQVAKITSST